LADKIARLLVLGVPTVGGVVVFLGAAALLRIEEMARMWAAARRLWQKAARGRSPEG
jgi:uncharacterized membrane protein YhiD involved in acid resistance